MVLTPEINHRELSQSEPFAIDAKALLEKYIKIGDKLHLVFDKTKQEMIGVPIHSVATKVLNDHVELKDDKHGVMTVMKRTGKTK